MRALSALTGCAPIVAKVRRCSGGFARRIIRGGAGPLNMRELDQVLDELLDAGLVDQAAALLAPYNAKIEAARCEQLASPLEEIGDVAPAAQELSSFVYRDLLDGRWDERLGTRERLEQLHNQVHEALASMEQAQ